MFTEVGFGNDKFVEIKNDFDVPVDMEGAGAKLDPRRGRAASARSTMPTGAGQSTIEPDEHVIIQETAVRHRLRLQPDPLARARSASGSS